MQPRARGRLLVVLGWSAALAAAQDPGVRARRLQACSELAAFVAREQQDTRVPAICLAVLDVDPRGDGEWAWATGVGTAADGRGRAGATTVFRVGSISKLLTATAALALVEQGRLDLDAPVQRWLPRLLPVPAG